MTRRILNLNGSAAFLQEGLSESPQAWEDGQRLPCLPGSFERWQFDAYLQDGSTLLITFFSKPMLERDAALRPGIAITLIPPNGKRIVKAISVDPADYSASHEHCYVRAGRSWVRGDADWNYELDVQTDELGAHLSFQSRIPPWRPGTGKFVLEDPSNFYGWLAAIPYGTVAGVVTLNGKMRQVSGYGYHDHRWGNVDLNQVFSHWYIGRARLNEYSLVFMEMTTAPSFGQAKLPALLLAKGNQILAASTDPIQLVEGDYLPDEGGRSYPQALQGCWETEQGRIRLGLRDPRVIDSFSLVDFLPTIQRLVGGLLTNPYHFTFTASLDLEINLPGEQARREGSALYELALLH